MRRHAAARRVLPPAADVPVGGRRSDAESAVAADIAAAVASVQGGRAMIVCRSAAEIERMRRPNQFVAEVLGELEAAVAPGVTTADLDRLAERLVREGGAEPAFKGYRGYPATLCASVNEEVVHGIPSAARVLRTGDIVSLDMGVKLDGFYGDSAVTVAVGDVPDATHAAAARDERSARARASRRRRLAGGCRTSATRFRTGSRRTGFRWCASSSATGSGSGCTKSRRSRTTGSPAAARSWRRAWCWRSSRWSRWAGPRRGCWATAGRR